MEHNDKRLRPVEASLHSYVQRRSRGVGMDRIDHELDVDPQYITVEVHRFFEDPVNLHLLETRWYPSAARTVNRSLLIVGGMHEDAAVYNIHPALSFESFPPKSTAPRPSEFLKRSLPANLFPRYAPSFPLYRSKVTYDSFL